MIEKILILVVSYLTGKLSQTGHSNELAAFSAETLKKIVSSLMLMGFLLIGTSNGILLIAADILIQQYAKDQFVLTPTLGAGIILTSVCLVLAYFVLKPQSKAEAQKQIRSQLHVMTPLAEALAQLVVQYTEERRMSVEQRVKS
ncbi:MAG: hypothetical protein ACK5P5_08875 [Pseudobdellovibrionaceae bacterium]